jgi:DnaJ-domain-containing protein 1
MVVVALGVLGLAVLVALGRRPLMARLRARALAVVFAAAAGAAAIYEAARGGWLSGSILLTAALWMGRSAWPRPLPSGMSVREAAAMLGVAEGSDREEIEAAYRRLMFRVHPDQGGAEGLAQQLNNARAVLLGRR